MEEEKEKLKRSEIANLIVGDQTSRLEDEELLHLLIQEKMSKDINSLNEKNLSLGDRMADRIARFAGSWAFILIFVGCLIAWIILNAIILCNRSFDPYPFILLNLLLSCIAAIQAPVIMMSQNRQEEKDRLRARNDYKVNLKSEIIVEDLHQKLDLLIENQQKMLRRIEKLEKDDSK